MLFEISHTTEYTYSDEVFFEPHFLRFKPKITPYSLVRDFSISIDPQPSGLVEHIDIENNFNSVCWFDDSHSKLRIISNALVEANEYNPFNFLVYPSDYLQIPFEYDRLTKPLLQPSLLNEGLPENMIEFIHGILNESKHKSIEFLSLLTKEIHELFSLRTRETGRPHKPDFTFQRKEGSCRDLVWMQIQMLRKLGIASRFVSGYFFINIENPEFELHAWVEAYLPGAGWIGMDPSHGILTDHCHIPVASSAFFENTMPVSATVRGNATSELYHELNIRIA